MTFSSNVQYKLDVSTDYDSMLESELLSRCTAWCFLLQLGYTIEHSTTVKVFERSSSPIAMS